MAVWTPEMDWPSDTPGGTAAPAWGGYVKLWVRAGIAPGLPFRMGPDTNAELNAGYVLGPAADDAGGGFLGDRLWVDLTCDVLDVEIAGGATSGQGIFGKSDAVTMQVTIADPDGIYDPLWGGGPFSLNGRSRLTPSVPVDAFVEIVDGDDGTVTSLPLFTGTADSWAQDWTPRANTRQTTLIASDQTKVWSRYNTPEQSPVGAGETVAARIARIVDYFQWPGDVVAAGSSTRTLAATTLASSGWELLNRTIDDELGALHFTPAGELRWVNREALQIAVGTPRLTLGCRHVDAVASDVLIDATPAKFDLQMRNDVWAANTGGISQHVTSQPSIDRFGPYGYTRTDLGLASDAQAAEWATFVVEMYAFPQIGIENVTMLPVFDPRSWELWTAVLGWQLWTDLARIVWAPPDLPTHVVDGLTRVVGVKHEISRGEWLVSWQTIAAGLLAESGIVFTLGPHANDHLDQGFILG